MLPPAWLASRVTKQIGLPSPVRSLHFSPCTKARGRRNVARRGRGEGNGCRTGKISVNKKLHRTIVVAIGAVVDLQCTGSLAKARGGGDLLLIPGPPKPEGHSLLLLTPSSSVRTRNNVHIRTHIPRPYGFTGVCYEPVVLTNASSIATGTNFRKPEKVTPRNGEAVGSNRIISQAIFGCVTILVRDIPCCVFHFR